MPPDGGKRTPLTPSYTWGQQGLEAQFQNVFQPGQGIFSPGFPLAPLEPERTRLWDFPVGVNTIYTPRAYEPISFAELRALADAHDITRLAIETRKDQLEKLDWTVKSSSPRRTDASIDTSARAARVAQFWRRPDGERPFATWLRDLLEDLLVLDAPALEIRRNRGGDLIGLDVVDGATLKVLFDDTGRRPRPPAPAFEQVIHGRPWKLLTSDQLLYLPRNPRPHKAYGFSPVEQIVMTVNIALRRQVMQLQHFTDGNVPPGLLNAPDGWSAEQIRQFQEWFDSVLAGNTGGRSRLVWGPSGTKYQPFKEAPYKDEFDEWLARIVCYAFSLPPTPFIHQVNRATADTAQEAALAEGLAPLMGWVKRLADHVIQELMGEPDLEFAWLDARPTDPATQAKTLDLYVRGGIYTVNEARDALGLAPVPGGDAALVYGTQGAVPLAAFASAGGAKPTPAARERGDRPLQRVVDEGGERTEHLAKDFDPDEPRIPAGDPDGGQWTDGGADPTADRGGDSSVTDSGKPFNRPTRENSGAGGSRDDLGEKPDTIQTPSTRGAEDTQVAPLLVAYPGDYHNAVVQQMKDYLTANGGKVITSVTLIAINGTAAVPDMIVKLPDAGPFILEVKTGPGAQFTDLQRIIYPMAQVGGHVYSPNPALSDVGLTPGQLLPPLDVYIYWVIIPGDQGKLIKLPPPEILP